MPEHEIKTDSKEFSPYVLKDEFHSVLLERDRQYAGDRRWMIGIVLTLVIGFAAGADQLISYRIAPISAELKAVNRTLEQFEKTAERIWRTVELKMNAERKSR